MEVYFGSFAICAAISLMINRKEIKSFSFIAGSVAIVMILSLVAGLRASTVGTDTAGYALNLYNIASENNTFLSFYSSSWWRIWRWVDVSSFEIGYLFLVWIARRLGSFQILLFLTSLLTVGPICYVLAKNKERLCLPISLVLFMLVYFNVTLNLMRQWVAVSLVFLAVFSLYDPRRNLLHQWKAYACLLVAFLFHSSAIMGLIPLMIRYALKGERGLFRYSVIAGVALALLLFSSIAQSFLSSIGFSKFVGYLGNGSTGFSLGRFLMQIPFLLISVFYYLSKKSDKQLALFFLCMATLSVMMSQLSTFGQQSGRISAYIDVFEIALVGFIVSRSSEKTGAYARTSFLMQPVSCFLVSCFVVAYGLVYWFFVYGAGSSETLPYMFFWQ